MYFGPPKKPPYNYRQGTVTSTMWQTNYQIYINYKILAQAKLKVFPCCFNLIGHSFLFLDGAVGFKCIVFTLNLLTFLSFNLLSLPKTKLNSNTQCSTLSPSFTVECLTHVLFRRGQTKTNAYGEYFLCIETFWSLIINLGPKSNNTQVWNLD